MKQQQPNLSDFFAKARSAPPVVSEADIDHLLDNTDLHGRQTVRQEIPQTTPHVYSQHTNGKRRIVMGSIAALLFGTVISAGIFFFGPENPDRIVKVPTTVGTPALTGKPSTLNAKEKTTPAESTVAVNAPAGTAMVPAPTEKLNGRGEGAKTDAPADEKEGDKKGEETSKIGEDISKELQTLIENYWVDKINGYKARIDGMMSRSDLDELNRLRVRWALTDKDDSPLRFAAMMEVNAVNSEGDEAKIKAGLGDDENVPNLALPQMEGVENANGKMQIMFGVHTDDVTETVTDSTSDRTVEKQQAIFIYQNDAVTPSDMEGVEAKEFNITIEKDENLTIDDKGDRKIVIKHHVVQDDADKTGKEMPAMEDGMKIESLDMTPLMGMLKMAISSDRSESSQIMVATWGIAEDHRPALDDLKQTVMNDVSTFTAMIRVKMADFVAEHGEELPAEMRDAMLGKHDEEGEADKANSLIKTLAPIYDILVEPMLLLYNGSDINGVLTSAIAEPVAGITLEANSTLKQSYPNPASAEATIEYSLQEPSTRTTLRIFDAQGSEVRNLDLGPQSAGTHQETINVKDLPGGTYLYHLTVGTSRGDQVFSKTMQIAR